MKQISKLLISADYLTPDKAPLLHPNTKSPLLISYQCAEKEGQRWDFSFWKAATTAFNPAAIIIPQAILSWPMSISCPFHCFSVSFSDEVYFIFPNPLKNTCSVSALLFGWLYYVYFEINSSNRSSCNKQIFAVALCLYKLRCSSNTLKSSLSCCLHSQMIRKSVKMLNFRCPGRSSQQHNSPRSQGMPFPEAALVKQGEAEIKGRAPPPTPLRAAIHSHIISFTGSRR